MTNLGVVAVCLSLTGCVSFRVVTDHPRGPLDGYYEYQVWVHKGWEL